MPRATWFCVDIECSGPVPSLYDMISLAAVAVTDHEASRSVRFELSEPFYVEIAPTGPRVDAGAMAVNGLDIEALRRDGLPLAEALDRLSAWVAERTVPGSKPVFVGHNAPFDWSFVSWAYVACDRKNPFGYKAFDTKAFAAGVLGLHWFDTSKEELEVRLALPKHDEAQAHRADYDAWYQAHILVHLLERSG